MGYEWHKLATKKEVDQIEEKINQLESDISEGNIVIAQATKATTATIAQYASEDTSQGTIEERLSKVIFKGNAKSTAVTTVETRSMTVDLPSQIALKNNKKYIIRGYYSYTRVSERNVFFEGFYYNSTDILGDDEAKAYNGYANIAGLFTIMSGGGAGNMGIVTASVKLTQDMCKFEVLQPSMGVTNSFQHPYFKEGSSITITEIIETP